ncbi:MAG: hypothetical protein K2X87_25825 [Gemmataceae bacterium]|nr:hypothetical protein [Gemmataceae bacterium]
MSYSARIVLLDYTRAPDKPEASEWSTTKCRTDRPEIEWATVGDKKQRYLVVGERLARTEPGVGSWSEAKPATQPVPLGNGVWKLALMDRGRRVVFVVLPTGCTFDTGSFQGTVREHFKRHKVGGTDHVAAYWFVRDGDDETRWKSTPLPPESGAEDIQRLNLWADGKRFADEDNERTNTDRLLARERWIAYLAMFVCLGIVGTLLILNRPFPDPNFAGFVRLLLALVAGTWGSVFTSQFNIRAGYKSPSRYWAIKAGGFAAFFVFAMWFTPVVLPNQFPVPFPDRRVNKPVNVTDLLPKAAPPQPFEAFRLISQRQVWKDWALAKLTRPGEKVVVLRSDKFLKPYLPFRAKVVVRKDEEDQPDGDADLNAVAKFRPGAAFLVGEYDEIHKQLDFVVELTGNEEGKVEMNPGNANYVLVSGAEPGTSLMLIMTLTPRDGREQEFRAINWHERVRLINLSQPD